MPEKSQQKTSPFSLKRAMELIDGLKSQIKRIDTEIKAIRDLLNVHDNWPAAIIKWKKKTVTVKDMNGEVANGTLVWSDRYNFAVDVAGHLRIYSKGGFIYMERG